MPHDTDTFTIHDCLHSFERAYLSHACEQLILVRINGRRSLSFKTRDFPGVGRVFLLGGKKQREMSMIFLADDHDESEDPPEWHDDDSDADDLRGWQICTTRYSPALTINAPTDRLPK